MISKKTFSFLAELAANNHRDWFMGHKAEYEASREDVLNFVAELISQLALFDPSIPADLDPKACLMRIYRDVRFSKNKTPYKTNFGIGISRGGKNFDGPGYYLHVSPGQCFIAAGCWMPEAEQLKAIRQEIDYNGSELKGIVEDPEFSRYFGAPDQESVLKTTPKGYEASHPYISYLKLKSFTFSKDLDEKDLRAADAIKTVSRGFRKIYPFMVFLRNALA